jgi:hypothetical protein
MNEEETKKSRLNSGRDEEERGSNFLYLSFFLAKRIGGRGMVRKRRKLPLVFRIQNCLANWPRAFTNDGI